MNLVDEIKEKPEIKVLLDMIKLSDHEVYNHSCSVGYIVENMLKQTKFSAEEKEEIIKGALLHDIGKIFIPFNLTQLPRGLSAQEFDIVKVHASISYEIVRTVFSKQVQDICLYHHERPNGSGYMEKTVLFDIPEEVLLVQVADVFDALTSERSYKQKYAHPEAIKIMKNEASKFMLDDQYVSILESCMK